MRKWEIFLYQWLTFVGLASMLATAGETDSVFVIILAILVGAILLQLYEKLVIIRYKMGE